MQNVSGKNQGFGFIRLSLSGSWINSVKGGSQVIMSRATSHYQQEKGRLVLYANRKFVMKKYYFFFEGKVCFVIVVAMLLVIWTFYLCGLSLEWGILHLNDFLLQFFDTVTQKSSYQRF